MNHSHSRSTLFLIEQLIVIAVFALCAAACVKILTSAYFMAGDSRDASNAGIVAESCAESFKAAGGDMAKVAGLLGGSAYQADGAPAVTVYYDKQWKVCGEDLAYYSLRMIKANPDGQSALLTTGDLSVEKMTGEVILAFSVTAMS